MQEEGKTNSELIYEINVLKSIIEEKDKKIISLEANLAGNKSVSNRISALIENLPDGILVETPDRKILQTNTKFCEFFNIQAPPIALKGSDCKLALEQSKNLFINPNQFIERIEEILNKREIVQNEILYLVDGRILERTYIPVKIAENLYENLWIYQDITLRKKDEESLRESEQRLRTLINATPDIICFKDGNGRWLIANDSDLELFALKNVNYFGKTDADLAEFTSPIYKESFLKCMQSDEIAWEKKILSKGEEIIPTVYGETKIYDVIKIPVFEEDGSRKGLVVLGRDITDRKKAESAIIEIQRLGAIGEMASSVAHDFNNSLQSILSNTELLLKKGNFSENDREYIETIRQITIDASNRIKLMQKFGGKAKNRSEFEPIDLSSIVSDVILQSRPLWKDNAEKDGISFEIKTSYNSKKFVRGNSSELRTVFYNLIKNAIEAMPSGGTIEIKTSDCSNGGCVTFRDFGLGMDDETKRRIFQPFFSTKGYEPGRGLGLSGSYGIIKEHDGQIYVKETKINKGTTFEVILPYYSQIIDKKQDVEETTQSSKNLKQAKILWVDDDETIRDIALEIIETLGHIGKVAEDGFKALEKIENEEFDLIITDIGMPRMTGWTLAEKIQEKYNGKQQIAVLSGWGMEISNEEKQKYGVNYVISKPMNINQIEKLIAKVLETK